MSGKLVQFPGAATASLDRHLPGDRAPSPQRIAAIYNRLRGERHRWEAEDFILVKLWVEKRWPSSIDS